MEMSCEFHGDSVGLRIKKSPNISDLMGFHSDFIVISWYQKRSAYDLRGSMFTSDFMGLLLSFWRKQMDFSQPSKCQTRGDFMGFTPQKPPTLEDFIGDSMNIQSYFGLWP